MAIIVSKKLFTLGSFIKSEDGGNNNAFKNGHESLSPVHVLH